MRNHKPAAANSEALLPTIIKSSLVLGALGSLMGVIVTFWWGLSGGNDTFAVGVFTFLVGGILGSMFGTLGVASSYFAATRLSFAVGKDSSGDDEADVHAKVAAGKEVSMQNRWICAVSFATPSTVMVLLMNIVSMSVLTLVLIVALGFALVAYAFFFVCPKILLKNDQNA